MNRFRLNEFLFLAVFLTVSIAGLWSHDLWTADEPREAAMILETAQTGDVVIPRLAGVPFIEKPPLFYILTAGMLKAFGPLLGNTAAIRLTLALFGLGVLAMTFLITRGLWDRETGILAALILLTMEGFISNYMWIRTDIALSFFVMATVWSFVEIYLHNRKGLLPLAGLFLAGAFLTKGFIGPVLLVVPWAGLAAIWFFSGHDDRSGRVRRFIIRHLGMAVPFVLLCGAWMLLLYIKGGPSLWNEWFWVNHVGRFAGTVSKGHHHPGELFYYANTAIEYGLPWSPLFIYWLIVTMIDVVKKPSTAWNDKNIFLYVWGVGSIALLTLSATKRFVYLLPVLPAFAVMSAVGIKRLKTAKWFTWYAGFWTALCLVLITIIVALPVAPRLLPASIPANARAVLVNFSYYHVIAGACLLFLLLLILRFGKVMAPENLMILAMAGLLISLSGAPIKAMDREKGMGADIRNFAKQIPESQRARIAGIRFDEIMKGNFYYYAGWRVPQITDNERITDILGGKDGAYDSLIVAYCHHGDRDDLLKNPEVDLVPVPYRILAEQATGPNGDRKIFWIKGR